MKNWNRLLAILLVMCMVLSMAPSIAAEGVHPTTDDGSVHTSGGITVTEGDDPNIGLNRDDGDPLRIPEPETDPETTVRAIVIFEDESLLDKGFTADEIAKNGYSVTSASRTIASRQQSMITKLASAVNKAASANGIAAVSTTSLEINYRYSVLFNGISVNVPYGVLDAIRSVDGVADAFVANRYDLPSDVSGTSQPMMHSSSGIVGAPEAWEAGYEGDGMRIAIIDTGLDTDHPSFAGELPENDNYLTKDEIANVIDKLNAKEGYSKLSADNVYISEKIPYAFCYVDNDLDVTHADGQGDHGTHVAGIAAANKTEGTNVVGVAPNAQILVMKVFGDNGGAYLDDLAAALEDCFWLGADAVNMSVGSDAGFSVSGNEFEDSIYSAVADHGMVLSVSAGNSASSAFGNNSGIDKNSASDPDNSIISSPSTYNGSTSVASSNNSAQLMPCFTLNGERIAYADRSVIPFSTLAGGLESQEMEYVVIPGYGTEEDFAAVGEAVTDRIALVSRGAIDFTVKQTNAAAAGAVGIIVYDNQDGTLMYMMDAEMIPNVFITKKSGEAMIAAAENGIGTITVAANSLTPIPLAVAGQISDFSSWGLAPNLTLAPDITAPGGAIYSTLDGGIYGEMSGTSMAAPHIAGMAALLIQSLRERYPDLKDAELHTVAEALLMSTATPIIEDTDKNIPYSPRWQGAGLANVYKAISSDAYLTVYTGDGNEKTPKASLGESATGVYSFTFTLNNLSGQPHTYTLDSTLLTDQVQIENGKKYMGETGRLLTDSTVTFSTGDSVTVPANGSVDVTVTITLGTNDKAYMEENYENGIYVDGFISLKSADEGGVDLGLPLVGFYGDWSAAPVFDTGWWWEDEATMDYDKYPHVVFTDAFLLGVNPYMNTPYSPNHNVISPNGDGAGDRIDEIYVTLMRNAKELAFTWTDDSGKVLQKDIYPYARKTYFYQITPEQGINVPTMFSALVDAGLAEMYDFAGLNNNDQVTLTISAKLDDGDDIVDESFEIPVTIDTEAPKVISAAKEGNTLTLTVSDNQYIAAVVPITSTGSAAAYYEVHNEPNGQATVTIDLTGLDSVFQIAVCDYGFNEHYYTFTLDDSAKFDENTWYAFRQISWGATEYGLSSTTAYNGWWTFESADKMTWRYADEVTVNAAEYVDGYIVGVDETGSVFVIRPGNWSRTEIGRLEYDGVSYNAEDMTLDYQSGTLYVLTAAVDGVQKVLVLDPNTGTVTKAIEVTGTASELLTLAADESGNLYSVNTDAENAVLYKLDAATGAATEIGGTGVATAIITQEYEYNPELGKYETVDKLEGFYQSMSYDHGENALYWATYRSEFDMDTYEQDVTAGFYKVDTTNGGVEKVSDVMDLGELTGLFKPSSECPDVINNTPAEALTLSQENVSLLLGQETALNAIPAPIYADLSGLTWSSSDDSIVTVEKGLITAKATGKAVITAKLGELTAECSVCVINPKGDLRVFDAMQNQQWLKIDASDASAEVMLESIQPSDAISAAAYRDGKVYAYDAGGNFYTLDVNTMNGIKAGHVNAVLSAMAFNYADGFMYGLREETVGMGWETTTTYSLVKVNVGNGQIENVTEIDMFEIGTPRYGMAIDYSGSFYFVVLNDYYELELVKAELDGDTLKVAQKVAIPMQFGNTGYGSLVYSDANKALFWANDWGQLIWIDAETLESVYVGGILQMEAQGQAINLGLLEVVADEPEVPAVNPTDATLPDLVQVLVGGTTSAGLNVNPWNTSAEIEYEIENPSIATVSADGVISGVAPGETTLTVKVGDITVTTKVVVLIPGGQLHGNMIQGYTGYTYNFWLGFSDLDPENPEILNSDLLDSETAVYAGTYYDGKIYAYVQTVNDEGAYYMYLATFDTESNYEMNVLGRVTYTIRDMAFDYTRGTLFAIEDSGKLLAINTENGNVTVIGDTGHGMAAITCDDQGQLYTISEDGTLYKVNGDTAAATEVGPTGLTGCTGLQSMHYDLNSGNTYWTYTNLESVSGGLYLVDLATGTATELGLVADGAMVTSLYTIPENVPTIPENLKPAGVVFDNETEVVPVGENAALNVTVLPVSVNAVDGGLTWTTSNASIATVDENGVVTGVAPGVVTITVIDSEGHTATITVVVPSVGRKIFAYDETNAQWVSFDETGKPTVVRKDQEGEELLKASYYVQERDLIYAYGIDGGVYEINPYTFERTKLGETELGTYEYWDGETYAITPVDMAYDVSTGKLYLAADAMTISEWGFYGVNSFVYEVDMTTGALTTVIDTEDIIFSNILAQNGKIYAVDCRETGMLNVIDPETGAISPTALVQGYWCEPSSSRTFFIDELTGTVYAIRDFAGGGTGGNGETPEPYLYIFNMNDASLEEVFAMGGDAYYNGVFVREPVEEPVLHGHVEEVRNAKAATCTEAGYTGDIVCTVCGEMLKKGEVIEALGHDWDAGIVTKEPTPGHSGEKTYTCQRCGETRVEEITAPGPGWVTYNGEWYFINSDGSVHTGWLSNGGKWYYMNGSGVMQTGWQKIGGKWYFLNNSGVMQTGWLQLGGKWYFLDGSGVMQTGWLQLGGKRYYLNGSGVMQTGWLYNGGKWYFLNGSGVMQTGWLYDGGKWYFLNGSGVMQTGWLYDGGKWYYLNSSGVMQTGWLRLDGKWYYLNGSGVMQTGWLQLGGKWYYLNSSGVMVTGTQTINGKTYRFNSSGVWIP